uniref:Uncharacterized protein n=2 Tax=Avena sativa TaxID=4498 RepID=A0ACD5XGI7_AVESA
MAKAPRAGGATPPSGGLPEDIVVWEILVRLPQKSLLRCRAVCRAWRGATSTRDFALAHHGRQPSLPIVGGFELGGARHDYLFSFDHRAADGQLQPVARFDDSFSTEISFDGLLILSNNGTTGTCFSVCNPATRQHAPLRQLSGFRLLGMYAHRPTGEYRLLLHRALDLLPRDQIACHVYVLGSDQPPRFICCLETAASTDFNTPALVRDSLHWYPVHHHRKPRQRLFGSNLVIVFDTISESFRQMCAPDVPLCSYIFEMDVTLGIYSCDNARRTVNTWVLQDYESEVWEWEWEYNIALPVIEIRDQLGWFNDNWDTSVVSVGGEVLLLVSHGGWMFYVDIDGELVDKIHRDGQCLYACKFQLKQTLVPHTFFTALEGYAVNALPFV